MSNDESSNVPDPNDRRSAVREKAQLVHARQRRARVIRTAAITVGAVIVVAGVATGVTMAVTSQTALPDMSPANLVDDGFAVTSVNGVAVESDPGAVDATPSPTPTASEKATSTAASPDPTATGTGVVDIRVYVDYYAPGAKQFQVANVQQLTRWVDQDAATLSYYPVAMLSAKSNGTKYSLRAASASACVATHSPASFFAFNNALLSQQPAQGDDGFTDEQLADLAIASGADEPKVVRDCVEGEDYVSWVKDATERALVGIPDTKDVSLTGTPMILVNGTPYAGALDDPKEFAQFVLTISSDAYYRSTLPTPSSTPSTTSSPSPSSTSK
ncbi:protein-disulfide isomerase [Microbacterium protaetiae]|uniref:Protein-disulfide isomerase n=1 Tax=Microbacterium protaetiae TaxID=2509458 RepID=A0A4V0YCX7_9MICO|nr:thioredoxin domain-containing protein [Microbacterium protaetiae]QAY58751.1 protein-disulfide isomerase [Microbacterium protaetiae]